MYGRTLLLSYDPLAQSTFFVDGHTHPKVPKSTERRGNDDAKEIFQYWGPHDLLRLFLFLLSPAPIGANRNRFYLLLTAAYVDGFVKS